MKRFLAIFPVLVLGGCNVLGGADRDALAEAIVDGGAPTELAATAPDAPVADGDGITDAPVPPEESAAEIPSPEPAAKRGGGLFGLFRGEGGGNNGRAPRNRPGPSAADFVNADVAVTPGLASCVTVIGRPDLAVDPTGPMSNKEIQDLLECTAERAVR